MATFIGYNTQQAYKKFTLVDQQLVIRDLLNAFNIKQGELPGRPQYGSPIWAMIFEQMTPDVQQNIRQSCIDIIKQDPRLSLQTINVFPFDNGMLMEIEVQFLPNTDVELLQVFFDGNTGVAVQV